jgi:hypothetical protein
MHPGRKEPAGNFYFFLTARISTAIILFENSKKGQEVVQLIDRKLFRFQAQVVPLAITIE